MHDSIHPLMDELGIEIDYYPEIKKEDVAGVIHNYNGIIVRSKIFIGSEFLQSADKLQYVCRAGAGIDNLNVEAIESRGIKIINAPEGNRNAVAEHCIGLVFNLLNNISKGDNEIRNLIWDREGNRGNEISKLNLGIIGYGFMGSAVSEKFSPLVSKIVVYDKYKTGYSKDNIVEASLEELFKETDILSIHVPLTDETKFMIDEEFISCFNKPIWVINTSRGEVLKLRGLINNIEAGKVRGAALDVLENEKLNTLDGDQKTDFDYLIRSNKVILTPHVAGWSHESYQGINEVLVNKLRQELSEL